MQAESPRSDVIAAESVSGRGTDASGGRHEGAGQPAAGDAPGAAASPAAAALPVAESCRGNSAVARPERHGTGALYRHQTLRCRACLPLLVVKLATCASLSERALLVYMHSSYVSNVWHSISSVAIPLRRPRRPPAPSVCGAGTVDQPVRCPTGAVVLRGAAAVLRRRLAAVPRCGRQDGPGAQHCGRIHPEVGGSIDGRPVVRHPRPCRGSRIACGQQRCAVSDARCSDCSLAAPAPSGKAEAAAAVLAAR